MNRTVSLAAALLLAGSSIAFAQSSGGSVGGGSVGGGSSVGGGTAMPRAGVTSSRAATGRATTSTAPADPMTNQNSLVSPQSQSGGVSTQTAPGSSVGEQVPVYGTNRLSSTGVAGSIDESSARSRGTSCGGTGQRSSTLGGTTTSTISGDCAVQDSLGTPSIISGSGGGAVDVSRP